MRRMCVCVCVCVCTYIRVYIHTYIHTKDVCICTSKYVCVCVYMHIYIKVDNFEEVVKEAKDLEAKKAKPAKDVTPIASTYTKNRKPWDV